MREAVFDVLSSMGAVEGAGVLDLFAGTGALAVEALSRGASSAVLVERDRAALEAIRSNLQTAEVSAFAEVVGAEVLSWLRRRGTFRADLVFCDPPYGFDEWEPVLGRLEAQLVVAESDRPVAPPGGWNALRPRRYGTTVVTLLEPRAGASRKG